MYVLCTTCYSDLIVWGDPWSSVCECGSFLHGCFNFQGRRELTCGWEFPATGTELLF